MCVSKCVENRTGNLSVAINLHSRLLTVLISLTLSLSEENAERIMLDPASRENLKFKDLLKVVTQLVHKHHDVSLAALQSSKI